MKNKIESTVIFTAKPGKIDELKTVLNEFISETLKEPGCETFRIFQNDEDPHQFVLWEIFKDEEALEKHMQSPHTQKCFSLGLFDPFSIIHQTEI